MTTETETPTQSNDTQTQATDVTADQAKDALYGKQEGATDAVQKETEQEVDEKQTDSSTESQDDAQQTDETKQDEAKTDQPYELKFDETLTVEPEVKTKLEAFGKEHNVPAEAMQNIVKEIATRQNEEVTNTIKAWQTESLSDKEFGGDNYETNIKIAAKPLQKYGTQKLVELLEQTGLNSNPEVIRVFHRIGKAMSEGESIDTTKAKAEPDILTKLYGPSTGK